jgi:hypothetical protein
MQKDNSTKRFDLEERTAKFGENIIEFAKKIPKDEITKPLITQLAKSGTSIGAISVKLTEPNLKKILNIN